MDRKMSPINNVIAKLREDLDRLERQINYGYDLKVNDRPVRDAFATLTGTIVQLNAKVNKRLNNTDETYNGWPNFETWCVSLWMDNEESSYHKVRTITGQHIDAGASAYTLASNLRDMHEAAFDSQYANVYIDLLNASTREVDWTYIAEHLMNEEIAEREYQAAERQARTLKLASGDDEDI